MERHKHKPIINHSIEEMITDPKIVRITFLTTFFHSLVVILLIIVNVNKLFVQHIQSGSNLWKIPHFIVEQMNGHITGFIVCMVILFVLYSLIYPIGQASIIHYLHYRKSIRHSIKSSLMFFYPMFELGFLSALFSVIPFFWIVFKVFFLNQSHSFLLAFLLLLWFLFITNVNQFKIYTKYFIVIHKLPLYESLRNSFSLVYWSRKTTSEYMKMQSWLLFNFSLNLVFIVWFPLLLIHFFMVYGLLDFWYITLFVYILFFFLVIGSAYMSSFIRAFFAYYWYDLFMKHFSHHKNL